MKLSKMTKEELEQLSFTKVTELFLKETNSHLKTAGLLREVCNILNLSESEYEEKLVDFFETLSTAKEFILLEDGTWDLKANHAVKIAINDIYEDEEEDYEIKDESEIEESDLDIQESDPEYDAEADANDDYEEDDLEDLAIVEDSELEE